MEALIHAARASRFGFPSARRREIQLGRTKTFEIVGDIGIESMPLILFVTAYDRHAVRAFEVHALDYVLKLVEQMIYYG